MSNQPLAHVADERAAFEAALAKECIKPLDDAEIEAAWCGGLGGLWRTARAAIPAGADVAKPDRRDRSPYIFGVKPSNWDEQIAAGAPAETPQRAFDVFPDGEVYERAPAETPKPVDAWTAGSLLTLGDSEYPGMGQYFGQVWQEDNLIARVYGDNHEDVQCRVARVLAAQPAPAPATDARDALDAARYRWLLDNYARGDGYRDIDAALNDGEPEKYLSPAIDAQIAAMLSANSPREAG